MFDKLKKKLGFTAAEVVIGAPVAGQAISIQEVNDPTFSECILGMGAAIIPSEGKVVSPVDGTIALMFDTGHAVSLVSDEGAEVLIHVGLETVKLTGKYYTVLRKNGDKVKKGDTLMTFDIDAIRAEGYDLVTPVIICNSEEYSSVNAHTGTTVATLDALLTLRK